MSEGRRLWSMRCMGRAGMNREELTVDFDQLKQDIPEAAYGYEDSERVLELVDRVEEIHAKVLGMLGKLATERDEARRRVRELLDAIENKEVE